MTDGPNRRAESRTGEARTPRARPTAARQLDVFAGRDVRGTPRQLELFGATAPGAERAPVGEVPHGAH